MNATQHLQHFICSTTSNYFQVLHKAQNHGMNIHKPQNVGSRPVGASPGLKVTPGLRTFVHATLMAKREGLRRQLQDLGWCGMGKSCSGFKDFLFLNSDFGSGV